MSPIYVWDGALHFYNLRIVTEKAWNFDKALKPALVC